MQDDGPPLFGGHFRVGPDTRATSDAQFRALLEARGLRRPGLGRVFALALLLVIVLSLVLTFFT